MYMSCGTLGLQNRSRCFAASKFIPNLQEVHLKLTYQILSLNFSSILKFLSTLIFFWDFKEIKQEKRMYENSHGSIIYTVIKIKQPKCPIIEKYLSDVIYSLVTILCRKLIYVYIDSGGLY